MTHEEAVKIIERVDICANAAETARDMAINALKKRIPLKPIGTYTDYKCSVCGRRVRSGKGSSCHQRDNYCQRCGQALDWEESQ